MTDRRVKLLGEVSLRLMQIISRPGGALAGDCATEMRKCSRSMSRRLGSLHDRGHIARRMDGKHWRYFIGREAAEAWLQGRGEKPAAPDVEPQPESFSAQWARLRGLSA